jgi:hypothetical protein
MGMIFLSLACLCAAGCVRSLHRGQHRPLLHLMMAIACFVVMLGCLHEAFIRLESLLP